MKTKTFIFFATIITVLMVGFSACENKSKDLTPPTIEESSFLPADCDIYYLGDTIRVYFICSDDTELGNFNIEIHNNFDHHTHGTSAVDCDEEEHEGEEHHHEEGEEHHHEEGEEHHHDHEDVEGAWVYNQDYAISRGLKTDTVDLQIRVPEDVLEGDYHFMVRLTDHAGWQTIKSVPIHLHDANEK